MLTQMTQAMMRTMVSTLIRVAVVVWFGSASFSYKYILFGVILKGVDCDLACQSFQSEILLYSTKLYVL